MTDYINNIYKEWKKIPEWNDSFEKYGNVYGEFTDERRKIHDIIICNYLKTKKPDKNHVINFVSGPPGVGKSVFVSKMVNIENKLIIDTDYIKTLLPEYEHSCSNYYHRESFVIAEAILQKALKNKLNIVLETTGKGPYKLLLERIKNIKKSGVLVYADYLLTSRKILLERTSMRARMTGRIVPLEIINNSLQCVKFCLSKLIKEITFDKLTIWNANNGSLVKVSKTTNGETIIYEEIFEDVYK